MDLREVERMKTIFVAMDKDGSGTISFEEGHAILNKELGFSKDVSRKFMKPFDKDGNGQIDYEEFIPFYFHVKAEMAKMKDMFDEFDRDGNGYISECEAIEILGGMFSEKEVKDLIKIHDKNGDGKLEFSEFVKFWNF